MVSVSVRSTFSKPPLSIDEQLVRLAQRGLLISQPELAAQHLKTVSYYRLSAYFQEFQNVPNIFQAGTCFEDIWQSYVFDRKLRLHVMDAIERIEVALRTSLIQVMSCRYGAWWYLNDAIFSPKWNVIKKRGKSPQQEFQKEITYICHQRDADFLKHYYRRYEEPSYPPAWMIIECLSFGKVNTLFRYIKKVSDRRAICEIFGYHPTIIQSTLEALRYTRNICAHHARLWNRWFVFEPIIAHAFGPLACPSRTFYELAFIISKLHKGISPDSVWKKHLFDLFEAYPSIPFHRMGFQQDWRNDVFWKLD